MDAPSKTPQGGLRVPASLTRSGVFIYHRADGSEVREYRPEEEVFKADSLATLAGAPVTEQHPSVMVKADNFQKFAKGHVGDGVVRNGERVGATLYVQDGKLVSAIERGDMREVSCGYTCDVVDEPGVTATGEKYDRIQRDISYNHVAIVPKGRAGSSVRLHLDAADNVIVPDEPAPQEKDMTKERIDGVDYDVGTEPHKDAIKRRDAAEKARKDAEDALRAERDTLKGKVGELEKKLDEMPAKIAEQAKERAALEQKARAVLGGETKLDGLTDLEVRKLTLAKVRPELKLDGQSDAYIAAAFDLSASALVSDLGAARQDSISVLESDGDETKVDADADYEAMVNRDLNRWKSKK